ncbi:hypothetical protein P3W85_41935 [Cupriavidus basilensis]|uniref:Transmembrane protein n=1 Tax=Cupriavidus basilensis TaxID=68895 RepID=A0ABT6B3L3_9BURK|nr:hypothetical protein [Cupriavidus basilensis]MDF3839453.1 hypothetical protein [Cupriavidus basilensis]
MKDVVHGAGLADCHAPPRLQWRSPWWAWQALSWGAATLAAPTFLTVGALLLRDARSDHPFFWPSLMAIVALANAAAILRINHLHQRAAFTRRRELALRYLGAGMWAGCAMFILLGWSTGVLPDMVAPMAGTADAASPAMATVPWSVAITLAFGMASIAHAAVLHAWIAFRYPPDHLR